MSSTKTTNTTPSPSFYYASLILSFAAGIASSASLYLYYRYRLTHDEEWWKARIDDLTSRIGELPSLPRRTHWPWDRKRQNSQTTAYPQNQQETTAENSNDDASNKSGFCIGSIFGLDVGGTLAKLVYFEERPEDVPDNTTTRRERSYRHSASAKAVLLARRAIDEEANEPEVATLRPRADTYSPARMRRQQRRHSYDSNHDLESLYLLRQESVPDDLHAYAGSFQSLPTEHDVGLPNNNNNKCSDDMELSRPKKKTVLDHMRKSRSMYDFQNRDQVEALDRFYNFARRLDSYREGVRDHKLSFYSRQLGGEFHFIRFETRRMKNAMDLIRANQLHLNIREMGATGGGAHKFQDDWDRELGIKMKKQDELDSLVAGMQFVLTTVVGECYTFRPSNGSTSRSPSRASSSTEDAQGEWKVGASLDDSESDIEVEADRGKGDEWWWSRKVQRDAISYSSTYPYLVVSIGTGVSILRVDGPRKFERISGSTIGGGTYLGLIRLLTDFEDYDEIMRLAERGDPTKVDMLVGDIYGDNIDALDKLGLPADLVASSFGKLVTKEDPAAGLKEEDLARALLLMITINIGQVAYLNAKLHKTSTIYFVGNFLRENKLSQRRLSFAIDYWSQGEMEGLFLEHEGYFGALGAFLLSQDSSSDRQQLRRQPESMQAISEHEAEPRSHMRNHTAQSFHY